MPNITKDLQQLEEYVAYLRHLISSGGGGGNATTDASLLTSGKLPDARLSTNVAFKTDITPTTDASLLTSGLLDNTRLNSSVTKAGNTFNGNSQLVQTTAGGKLPILDGSNLTNLPSSGSTATITDNLTNSTPGTALDAHQGFVIKGLIDTNTTTILGKLTASNNLSDLSNTTIARTNLGLGTLATQGGTFSGTSSGTNTGDETTTRINTLYGYTPANPANFQPVGSYADRTISNSYTAGTTQIFSANTTNSGFRLSGVTANPSSLSNGDIWYRVDENKLHYYDGSVTRSLVSEQLSQILTNKTIAAGSNTITGLGASNMTLPQQSMIVNNTNATATPTTTTYTDGAEQTYSGTITWTGTTAPSGTATNTYQWTQVGKLVTLRMTFAYATAGASITLLSMPLPTDCPTPLVPSGFTGAGAILYTGVSYVSATNNTTLNSNASRSVIRINAGNNGYEVAMTFSSINFKYGWVTIQYWAQ